MKPRIAMVIGDPAGIGSELVAKLLAATDARDKADILLVADRDEIEEGMRIAGARFDYRLTNDPAKAEFTAGLPLLFSYSGAAARPYARGQSTANGGRYSLDTLERCIDLTAAGVTEAVCFAPLNKSSMHQAGLAHNDETHGSRKNCGRRARSASLMSSTGCGRAASPATWRYAHTPTSSPRKGWPTRST